MARFLKNFVDGHSSKINEGMMSIVWKDKRSKDKMALNLAQPLPNNFDSSVFLLVAEELDKGLVFISSCGIQSSFLRPAL